MDQRIVVTLVCMATALVCNFVLLAMILKHNGPVSRWAFLATLYGSAFALIPGAAFIFHILKGQI